MKAFLTHVREHRKAVLLVALLAAVIGALLPMWIALPINAALGWALGSWPHGVEIGPLRLLRRFNATAISLASWHWAWSATWRWSLTWQAPSGREWFLPFASFTRTYRGVPGLNFSAALFMPLVGSLHLSAQPNVRNAKFA